MLESQTLEIQRIELRKQINVLGEDIEKRSADDTERETRIAERSALQHEMGEVDDKLIAALKREDAEAQAAMARNVDDSGWTAELREFRDLAQRTSIGQYVLAAAEGREIREGAEFEYNKHVLSNWSQGDFPLEMLLNRDEMVELGPDGLGQMNTPVNSEEHRAEITGVASTHGTPTFMDRIFADSEGAYLRAVYPAVGPGRHSYPIVSGTGDIGAVIARGTAETVAGGITVTDADPERIQASFEIAAVDELTMPGITNYLGGDIRAALMEGLDNKVVDDLVSASTATDIAAAAMTLATFLAGMGRAVNGRAARFLSDVRVLAGNTAASGQTTFYSAIAAFVAGNINDGAFNILANARASAHMASASGNHDEAFFIRMGPSQPRLIVPVWRRGQLLRDTSRLQLQHATTLTGVMYADVIRVNADQHFYVTAQTQ